MQPAEVVAAMVLAFFAGAAFAAGVIHLMARRDDRKAAGDTQPADSPAASIRGGGGPGEEDK